MWVTPCPAGICELVKGVNCHEVLLCVVMMTPPFYCHAFHWTALSSFSVGLVEVCVAVGGGVHSHVGLITTVWSWQVGLSSAFICISVHGLWYDTATILLVFETIRCNSVWKSVWFASMRFDTLIFVRCRDAEYPGEYRVLTFGYLLILWIINANGNKPVESSPLRGNYIGC